MCTGLRNLATKLADKHAAIKKLFQFCCCCLLGEISTEADGSAPENEGGVEGEEGGGDEGLPPGSARASQAAANSIRGSPGAAASYIEDGEEAGPSGEPVEVTEDGTPLHEVLPPPTTTHEVKENSSVPAGETTLESIDDGDVGFIEAAGDETAESGEQDVGFIETVEEEEPLCIVGKVLITLLHYPDDNKLDLAVLKLDELPTVDRGGAENVSIHLCVLPGRKQRFKGKPQSVLQDEFNQAFTFSNITPETLETTAIRLRVYGKKGFLKQKLIGEVQIALGKENLTDGEEIWKSLSPKGDVPPDEEEGGNFNLSDLSSLASFGESATKPELLINLHYTDLTGRLTVEVIQAANLKKNTMIIDPDTFVKIKCVSGKGKRIGKSKTTVRRLQSSPEYNETFIYPLSDDDLEDATMMFQVYSVGKRRKKRELLGWFAYGLNNSGPTEAAHWQEMCQNKDCDVCHWQELKSV
uniref:C2 domain-containing protein n=1 Tax=Clytia hemisphaerica TaxID=252671 RepID=A0A7M5X1N8_9CNID